MLEIEFTEKEKELLKIMFDMTKTLLEKPSYIDYGGDSTIGLDELFSLSNKLDVDFY